MTSKPTSVPSWREASVDDLVEKVDACLPYPGATSMPEHPYKPRESRDAKSALNELARRARDGE